MMMQRKIFKNSKNLYFILGAVLILSVAGNIWLMQKVDWNGGHSGSNPGQNTKSTPIVEEVSAKEIYPLFECPCCGKSIDECTCPMAKERKNYVDVLIDVSEKSNKEEIISAYIKKYGLNSFMDKQKQKEYREKLIAQAPADRPIISLSPESYDLGDVSQKQGTLTHDFELKNQGKNDLIIDKIETSCGCTSASIVYKGKEGPKFNMPGHGVNEKIKDWQAIIPPGGKAELKVYYDPNVHTDFRGEAIRSISVFSNDPVDFEKKVQIELNQVD